MKCLCIYQLLTHVQLMKFSMQKTEALKKTHQKPNGKQDSGISNADYFSVFKINFHLQYVQIITVMEVPYYSNRKYSCSGVCLNTRNQLSYFFFPF